MERAGVATAAAVQRMRGLPEPVGLGTERQHMFMASFLPPLPSFSLSRLLCLSCSSSLSITPYPPHFLSTSFGFACPGITSGRHHSTEIKGHWGSHCPLRTAYYVSLMLHHRLLTATHTYTPLCHFVVWHMIREYSVQQVISCGCAGALCFIFDAFPRVGHQHLGLSLPYINIGCYPSMSEPTISEYY